MTEQLASEIKQLLARMLKVSEVPARRLQSSPGGHKPDSQAPTGVNRSLFDEWSARFNAAEGDELRTRRLVHFARAALYRATGEGMPAHVRMRGVTDDPSVDTEPATVEDILELGQGMDALELAAIISEDGKGYCPPAYIRRVRVRNGMSPKDGRPRPAPEQRVLHALKLLHEPGATQARVAAQMGVAQSTISRWLSDIREGLAA